MNCLGNVINFSQVSRIKTSQEIYKAFIPQRNSTASDFAQSSAHSVLKAILPSSLYVQYKVQESFLSV